MKKMIGIIMMISGLILLVSGYFVFANKADSLSPAQEIETLIQAVTADGVLTDKEKKLVIETAEKNNLNSDDIIGEIELRIDNSEDDAETEIVDQASKNGYDFEKYIVKKFPKKLFTISKWAGDKYVDGIYSAENQNPDIIVEFTLNDISQPLAVECKWRSKYNNGKIKFSYDEQLERYKKFEKENHTPVYIVLGVGRKASTPDELFLFPVKDLTAPYISKKQLEQYRKNPENLFYYVIKTRTLDIAEYNGK